MVAYVAERVDLAGIHAALVTPWREGGGVDVEAFERLIQRACAGEVAGLCAAGTTGEGPRLSRVQRVDLVKRCAASVSTSVVVTAGVVTASISETLQELEAHARAGAHAALVTPPTRMPLGDAGCRTFYTTLADKSPLPVIVYHIPALTGVQLSHEVIVDLSAHPAIIGLKDSSADIQFHSRVASELAPDPAIGFALLTGTDAMLVASMQAGGQGAIVASANLVPALSVAVLRFAREGNFEEAVAIQQRLHRIVTACRRGSGPAGWKAALESIGVCSRLSVPPGETLPAKEMEALREDLRHLQVLA